MNNTKDQEQGSGASSIGSGTEGCKVMVLYSEDILKLTNLEFVRPLVRGSDVVEYCSDYHCNRRCKGSRQDHDLPRLVASANSFLQNKEAWMLVGDVCINLHDKAALHLKLKLSAGNLEESVKLMVDLERYPFTGNGSNSCILGQAVDDFIKRIESLVCKITLLDHLKNTGDNDNTCFQLGRKFDGNGEKVYFYYNDNFCSQSALKKACQVSPEGANKTLGTSSAFEFVDAKIETTIRIKEISGVLTKSSLCFTQAFQLKQSSFKKYLRPKTEFSPELALKFTEIVVLKAGDGSQEKFYVPKNRLIQESPVFKKMFEVSMSEKTTGEVTLNDCTVQVLEAFIRFLYENVSESELDERVDILLDVLVFAHQYDTSKIVQNMKTMIISVRNESLNLKLALRLYAVGYLYEMPDLKFRALHWIKCNKIQVLTVEGKKQVQALMDDNKNLGSSIFLELLNIP